MKFKKYNNSWLKAIFVISVCLVSGLSLYSQVESRPKAGVRWAFQAIRQDRNFVEDRFRSTSTLFPVYDIQKDVHQPSRFGLLEFTNN